MKSEWKRYALGDITELVIDYRGKTPKKLGGDWSHRGYRALSAKNIKTGHIVQPDTIRFVDEDMYRKWMKDEIRRGDILITSEAPFGQILFWDSDEKIVLSQRLFGVRIKKTFDPKFIYYYMTTSDFQGEMAGRATGTTVIGLRQPELMKCEVCCPDIERQKRIASILSSIDEKIELNDKINENLEQQAQAIYQEWFGNINMEKKQGMLSDICTYSKDRVSVSELDISTYFSTENMLPGKAGATEASNLPTTAQTTACHVGDTLISNIRPYFKKIVYCHEECGCSTDVLCFVPAHPKYSAYLYSTLYADRFFDFMVAGSKGTKMPRGDKQQIMTYPVTLPTDTELERFNSVAGPILMQIQNNRNENKRLSALRDTVLPKLMNGEIDIDGI